MISDWKNNEIQHCNWWIERMLLIYLRFLFGTKLHRLRCSSHSWNFETSICAPPPGDPPQRTPFFFFFISCGVSYSILWESEVPFSKTCVGSPQCVSSNNMLCELNHNMSTKKKSTNAHNVALDSDRWTSVCVVGATRSPMCRTLLFSSFLFLCFIPVLNE